MTAAVSVLDLELLLRMWKTRRKVIAQLDYMDTGGILYQLDKCIENLESEIEYERTKDPS